MTEHVQTYVSNSPPASRAPTLSRLALILALAVVAANLLLFSPPRGQTYPGAIPWGETSLLRPLVDVLSLNGLVASARGVEIKEMALHFGAALALALAGTRLLRSPRSAPTRETPPWFGGAALYAGFVALSALSALWSGDPGASLGQAALYGFLLAWALAIGLVLERRDLAPLMSGLVALAAITGALCVWYYLERNPHHRPGFPVGNPGPLTAVMTPGILICTATLAAAFVRRRRGGEPLPGILPPWAAAALLIPICACFWLAGGRSAAVGLLVGVGFALFLLFGRRAKAIVVGAAVVLLIVGGLYFYQASYDLTMARGATIRFRAYVWRYAAELWMQHPLRGHGAGAFPRLAGQLAIGDRALDPGAFMGALAEHAHNELFEVLVETGGVGAIFFLGAFLATLVLAARSVRRAATLQERLLLLALPASVAALLTDTFLGASLRLPGVPAVLFTLMGAIWALARGEAAAALPAVPTRWFDRVNWKPLAAPTAIAGVILAAVLAQRNASAVMVEHKSLAALANRDFASALASAREAETGLLDPVRRLIAANTQVRARFGTAETALEEFSRALQQRNSPTTAPASPSDAALQALWQESLDGFTSTYEAAHAFDQRAPRLLRVAVIAARSAEGVAALARANDPEMYAQWSRRAEMAWRMHRKWSPYDVETLLALTRYADTLPYHVGLLRDALREGDSNDQQWLEALGRVAAAPEFPAILEDWLAAAGPLTSSTHLETLIASMAPETYRLAAAYEARRREATPESILRAAQYAERAAELYRPMQMRFPTLLSIALAEQADYLLLANNANAPRAIELLDEAIARLPLIQEQHYNAMVTPFRVRRLRALVAAGRDADAAEQLREILGGEGITGGRSAAWVGLAKLYARDPQSDLSRMAGWLEQALRESPTNIEAWSWLAWIDVKRGDRAALTQRLEAARKAGLPPQDIARIRYSLSQEFRDQQLLDTGP